MRLVLVVAAALIDSRRRVLLARRPEEKSMPGLWEFPGGKVNENETPEFALVRELNEELDIMVGTENLYPAGFASYSYEAFHLLMPLYACYNWRGSPRPLEHSALEWARLDDMENYSMPEADRPLIYQLRRSLRKDV
jgi:8-oxo-dGTP diphosphatase